MAVTPNHSFSVVTYNVNFAVDERPNAQKVVQGIVESAADIVLLQEATAQYENTIRRHELLSSRYPHQHWDIRAAAGGQAFLSRFPVRATELWNPSSQVERSWFMVNVAYIEIPSGDQPTTVRFVNVHLRPPLNDDGSAGLLSARSSNAVRLAEIQYILKQIRESTEPDMPTIIAGDFNENERAPGLVYLTSKRDGLHFRDALQEFVPWRRETHRWPLLWGLYTSKKRLDHIVYSIDSLHCEECQVLAGYEEGASDHQPVVAKFSFVASKK